MEFKSIKLGEIAKIKTGKSNTKDAIENAPYTFFDRSKLLKKSDKFLYDEEAIIIPGEGKEFYPQYYVGKYDLHQRCYSISDFENKINSMYIYYSLRLKNEYFQKVAVGSTVPSLRLSHFQNCQLNIPSIENQNKTAGILNYIDLKIELNNKTNDNLYNILKLEFRNKFYIQNGNFSKLIDLISETLGGDWGKEKIDGNNNTKVFCIRGADIPSMEFGNKGKAPTRYILEKNCDKKKLTQDTIVIEISGGSPTQSTGRTAYITSNIIASYENPIICTNFCRAIKLKDKKYAPFFYMTLKLMYEDNLFFNWENGTTGIKNLALNALLENVEVSIPNEEELNNYNVLFNSIINKISSNSNENKTLEQLRDTLLPKLMNGEIDLENIEI